MTLSAASLPPSPRTQATASPASRSQIGSMYQQDFSFSLIIRDAMPDRTVGLSSTASRADVSRERRMSPVRAVRSAYQSSTSAAATTRL
jgi:hypothetical protein